MDKVHYYPEPGEDPDSYSDGTKSRVHSGRSVAEVFRYEVEASGWNQAICRSVYKETWLQSPILEAYW